MGGFVAGIALGGLLASLWWHGRERHRMLVVDLWFAAAILTKDGVMEFHGRQLARAIEDWRRHPDPIPFGSLYRALDELERDGYFGSRLESTTDAFLDDRSPRRLYCLKGRA